LDADLRHPSVAAAMGDGSSDGWLNDALVLEEGSGTWPTVWPVRADRWSRLQYMASRRTAEAAPQDLLASPAMHGVLERAAHEYDIVLVDSPPVLAAADALILASQVEATLVVVRWRRTPRDALALAVSQITRAGGRLIGAVLNEVDVEHGVFDHGDPEAYRQGAVARYYGARGAV
jgi:Mrp family chromosome partitioning ATPase